MKSVIFNTIKEAENWDWHHNHLTGSVSTFEYNKVPLKATTTLTKAQYAELMGIPAQIVEYDEEGGVETVINNSKYTALQNSYTLHKCAMIVNDDLNQYDDKGTLTGYGCKYCGEVVDVVEITDDMLPTITEEL